MKEYPTGMYATRFRGQSGMVLLETRCRKALEMDPDKNLALWKALNRHMSKEKLPYKIIWEYESGVGFSAAIHDKVGTTRIPYGFDYEEIIAAARDSTYLYTYNIL